MQTFELHRRMPGRPAIHGIEELAQPGCPVITEDGKIGLTAEPGCEIVRLLLAELQAYRQARGGPWRLDRLGRSLIVGTSRVCLTRTQFGIVDALARAGGEFVSVNELLQGVWGFVQPIGGNEVVRTHIRALRQRLRQCGVADDFITSARGRGYRINPRFGSHPSSRRVLFASGAA